MGKTVYCISNGSPDIFPDNTLTSFGNKFPFLYDYGEASHNYKLQVAVDSIGFSLNFNQRFLPDPMNNPCIILEYLTDRTTESKGFTLKNNVIEPTTFPNTDNFLDLKNRNKSSIYCYRFIHFENSTLDINNVSLLMSKLEDILNVKCDTELNTVTYKLFYKEVHIYFNRLLFPFIKVGGNFTDIYNINGDNYELFLCKLNQPVTIDFNGVFSLNLPKIIKVRCKNIRDQIFNNTREKDLLVFCPQIDHRLEQKKKYFFHEFETRTYCTLENTILDQISFELVNEYNEQLHLDTGVPSLLKLDIIAMEKSKKSFNVRIASGLQDRSKFTIKLPQTLHFNEHWRVSLSSINLPNTFNTFNIEDDFLTIYYRYDPRGDHWGYEGAFESSAKLEFKIPNKIYTKKELFDLLNSFLVKNELNRNIGEIKEEKSVGQNTTTVKLTLKAHGWLDFPAQFVELFGKCKQNTFLKINNYVGFFNGHSLSEDLRSNPHITPFVYEFEGPANIDFFQPSYIMLYSDIIQPITVSGVYMNIMKIFPTSPLKIPYVIKEFKKVDYLSLNNYEIKEMSFQLRNHAGELISFDKDNHNPVILNLHFTNYPN